MENHPFNSRKVISMYHFTGVRLLGASSLFCFLFQRSVKQGTPLIFFLTGEKMGEVWPEKKRWFCWERRLFLGRLRNKSLGNLRIM